MMIHQRLSKIEERKISGSAAVEWMKGELPESNDEKMVTAYARKNCCWLDLNQVTDSGISLSCFASKLRLISACTRIFGIIRTVHAM